MTYLCPHCNSFPWMSTFGGSLGEKAHKLVVRDLWRKYYWKQPNRLLVVQTGESVNQAKVFRANALKLKWEPTRRWRRPHTEHLDEPLRGEQEGPHGGVESVHTS